MTFPWDFNVWRRSGARGTRLAAVAVALLAALALGTGCRRGRGPLEEPTEEKDDKGNKKPKKKGGAEGTGDGDDDGDAESNEGSTGPKMMGYQYFTRQSFGLLSGTYSDKQENADAFKEESLSLKVSGMRYVMEHYPVVYENFPYSQYGFALVEIRREKPAAGWWLSRDTMMLLMGFILPKMRLIAPVVGIHWEFNRIDMSQDDSPEVSKADIRATVLGVEARQKIWGTGTWFSAFYTGRLHLLNLTQPNNGWELELGLGGTLQVGQLRSDAALGWLEQRYHGKKAASDDEDVILKLDSRYGAATGTVTLWL
jgi:hypothetical protein